MKFCGMHGIVINPPDDTPLPDSHGEDHVSPVFKDYTCFAVAAVLSHQAVETIVTDSKRPS